MSTATLVAPTLMTAEEFLRLHGGECGVDLVEGRVVREPMPSPEHGRLCFRAALILNEFVEPRDLGRLMTNDSFVHAGSDPDSVRGADVCYISHQRLPKDQPLPADSFQTPPELVIEVRSPSDRISAITKKIDDYLTEGGRCRHSSRTRGAECDCVPKGLRAPTREVGRTDAAGCPSRLLRDRSAVLRLAELRE